MDLFIDTFKLVHRDIVGTLRPRWRCAGSQGAAPPGCMSSGDCCSTARLETAKSCSLSLEARDPKSGVLGHTPLGL